MELINQFKKILLENGNNISKITVKNYTADVNKFISWFETTYKQDFPPGVITQEIMDAYLNPIKATSLRSAKRYESSLRKFLDYLNTTGKISYNPLASRPIHKSEMDPLRLKEFNNYLYASNASPVTTKNYILDIRQFLSWAQEVGKHTDVLANIDTFMLEEYKNRLINQAALSPLSVNRKLSALRKYLTWANQTGIMKNQARVDSIILSSNEPIYSSEEKTSLDIDQLKTLPAHESELEAEIEPEYSRFGPLRLMQKSKNALNLVFDTLVILSILKTVEAIKYNLWKATGKEIFAPISEVLKSAQSQAEQASNSNFAQISGKPTMTVVDQFITMGEKAHLDRLAPSLLRGSRQVTIGRFRSIPKSVYAPLSISTNSLSSWEKIIFHLKFTRPKWYKSYHSYSFVHYLHFAALLVFATWIGFNIFNSFHNSGTQTAVLASHVSPGRLLSFQGRLNDAQNVPVTKESIVKFAIYNSSTASGQALLWQESQTINPDIAGNFSTVLGQINKINQDIFNENPNLYLGISIGSAAELSPRQELANTGLTKDSESLQGLKPLTVNNADSANKILALDSSGNLTIGGSSSPVFQATGGEFKLSGQSLALASNIGSNGNITLSPDGTGIIDLQKPLQNTSNNDNGLNSGAVEVLDNLAIISSGGTETALVISQNGSGDIISALSGGSAKFTLNNAGSGSFSGDLSVLGNSLNTVSGTFYLANTNTTTLNIGGAASTISLGAASGTTTVNNSLRVSGALILPTLSLGSIPFINNENKLSQDNANFFWDQSNKRLGIGTSAPGYRLDVQDLQDSKAAAQIFNSSTSTTSVGLQIKLGITGTPQLSNRWINFLDGNGTVMGKISGSGSANSVKFESNGGDFAEYFKKSDPRESFGPGDLICYSTQGGVEKCNQKSNGILGIFSDEAGFVGSGSHEGDSGYVLVGLIGQLKINVSPSSEAIKPGDPITSSSIPGIAVKATKAGQIIGRALESYDPASNQPTIRIALNVSWHDPRAILMNNGKLRTDFETTSEQNSASNTQNYEKAVISIQNFISTLRDGVLEVGHISTTSLSVATDDIKIGTQTLKEYISSIVNDIVDRKIAENNKKQISILSPIAKESIESNKTPIIASASAVPTDVGASSSATPRNDEKKESSTSITNIINIYNTASASAAIASSSATVSDSASPSATPTPSASPSAELTPTPGLQPAATPSATPTPSEELRIKNQELSNENANVSAKAILNTKYLIHNTRPADIATYSAELSYIPNLKSDFGAFSEGIIALGPTSLTETSINGTLSLGSSMKISGNSLDTIGTDLNLQPLRQGNLSIMGGLISVNTEGNLSVQGNANFAKDVTINGTLAAGIISPLANSDVIIKLGTSNQTKNEAKNPNFIVTDASGSAKFSINQLGDVIASGAAQFGNIKIIRGAQADTSFTETIASGSAGTALITTHETERTIISPYVTENSLIYITPLSDTKGITPYIARQTAENPTKSSKGSFTIQIPASQLFDIKLNWIIVN